MIVRRSSVTLASSGSDAPTLLQSGQSSPFVVAAVTIAIVAMAGLAFVVKIALYGNFGRRDERPPPDELTNCSGCGTRIAAEQDYCESCAPEGASRAESEAEGGPSPGER